MERKVYYIAGPQRANTREEVTANVEKARAAATAVWRMGHAVICPHTNSGYFDTGIPEETFMEGSLEILRRCDGIVMMPGWEASAGSRHEKKVAEMANLQVFYLAADLSFMLPEFWGLPHYTCGIDHAREGEEGMVVSEMLDVPWFKADGLYPVHKSSIGMTVKVPFARRRAEDTVVQKTPTLSFVRNENRSRPT